MRPHEIVPPFAPELSLPPVLLTWPPRPGPERVTESPVDATLEPCEVVSR